jgi:flavin reductase (DIM6/NTAB) family NADH-FMN oxidoreductase RutF
MKKKLGAANLLYPMPTVLVGAVVDGRPNVITIAHVGIVNASAPHLITLGMGRAHHTNRGIREHGQFSVNLPGEGLVVETDYCGIVSGKRTDKAGLFDLTYGELDKAPLIAGCPVSMACRLERVVEFATHDLFVGEIVETYVDDAVLTEDALDLAKLRPLLFEMPNRRYWSIGLPVAKAWHAGKSLKR